MASYTRSTISCTEICLFNDLAEVSRFISQNGHAEISSSAPVCKALSIADLPIFSASVPDSKIRIPPPAPQQVQGLADRPLLVDPWAEVGIFGDGEGPAQGQVSENQKEGHATLSGRTPELIRHPSVGEDQGRRESLPAGMERLFLASSAQEGIAIAPGAIGPGVSSPDRQGRGDTAGALHNSVLRECLSRVSGNSHARF